ncbi:MAG: Sec-independent protein translocase protein TatB [Methylococcaceae bacterium]|jgi:sec-independent protein translocase protein TatB
MFEVGFSEICMIGLVALLVIGPERLPKVARLAGFWLGKTRTMVAQVKAEIKDELHAEEMRQMLNAQESELNSIQQTVVDAKAALQDTMSSDKVLLNSSPKPAKTSTEQHEQQ